MAQFKIVESRGRGTADVVKADSLDELIKRAQEKTGRSP